MNCDATWLRISMSASKSGIHPSVPFGKSEWPNSLQEPRRKVGQTCWPTSFSSRVELAVENDLDVSSARSESLARA